MDATLGDDGTTTATPPRATGGAGLSTTATVYLTLVAAAAAASAFPALSALRHGAHGWRDFVILAIAASVAQLFKVETVRDQSMHAALVFALPAAFLLPPGLAVLFAVTIHIPEWLKERYPWFIQTFNISNWVLSVLAAWGTVHLVLDHTHLGGSSSRAAFAGFAATAVFVLLSHGLLAVMLKLGRGHTVHESGLFRFESLSADLVIVVLGTAIALLWRSDPWLVPAALAPLFLIHRALSVAGLQEQARVDSKTGLFNARYFGEMLAEELNRARRFDRPLSVVMADLDLLREINNTYGHLAGDAVLKGVAVIFRDHLRNYDVPARFGGEEFAIVLPETTAENALEIAERIRRSVAAGSFEADTSSEPISATISIGVATFPDDGTDAQGLLHQADLAVYRAKLQGRNRVLAASSEPLDVPDVRTPRSLTLAEDGEFAVPLPSPPSAPRSQVERRHQRSHSRAGSWYAHVSSRLGLVVSVVAVLGIGGGIAGLATGRFHDPIGLVAVVLLVGIGQAIAVEFDETSISVAAVGAIAGAALFGPEVALPLAITSVSVAWSATRTRPQQALFNVGSLSLAALAAAGILAFHPHGDIGQVIVALLGLVAGAAYYAVNMGLLSLVVSIDGHSSWRSEWEERFRWLVPHYVAYGFVGAVIAIAYHAAGLYALAAFAVPLFVMRQTQHAYVAHAQRSTQKLRNAARTIQSQNQSLERANRLLKERSTAAMESLSATADARDAYTAGHSRRVQTLALAIGRELGLSATELEVLGQAALFHDIGKIAVPDSILLKPDRLTGTEWVLMQLHAEEGASIISHLGFLADAVPAIRHHHERFDGTGYPDRLRGDDIPLGARVIHVADAFDSMLSTRVYRPALPPEEAMAELRRHAGTQFCPRCVSALEQHVARDGLDAPHALPQLAAIAS